MFKFMTSIMLLLVSKAAISTEIVEMEKLQFKSLYYKMMVDTYQQQDNSPLAGMGGTPVPYVLIYDVKNEKFVSDQEKYKLLKLDEIDNGAVLKIPTILSNKPKAHHYFDALKIPQLKHYIPDVNTKNEYIVIMSIPTIKEARGTEQLIKKTGMQNYVSLPKLVAHINKELKNKNWQIFKYTSS
ncbi:hypothetical protein C1E24_12145 [Pseudoalteromonas phenolica]|uniref:Uncharacterized protein n=1 Tax=Pseudoalteromonas phenolica TaxID=161398 RepID=A0A5R9Q2B5_9GAMM|nr:hypothetical protein [Pseudoalteromonas phenolica]TLX46752.1 hypothetical protein C1E24_12145 [Pseudoalteromonas phenolica]